ncbi:SDR family oxidoreductase [Streptomyces sp. NPDC014894]|uniref:SDR family oxidoreductase n=1 Tax=Streptomyces sp. NPDC014894 TaxID=3364931 RepID=UPI0036F8F200
MADNRVDTENTGDDKGHGDDKGKGDGSDKGRPPAYVPAHGLLAGRTAVLTAAAGTGIGGATARRFLEEGARIVVSDAHPRRLAETGAALVAEFGARAVTALPCDVTDETQVRALFARTAEEHGGLDIVVNNAGLGGTAALVEMTDAQWDRVLDVTLNGTFRCVRAALRSFRAAGRPGVIVNNSSVLGWRAQAGQAHYAAAKAGVMALTRCAAIEAAEYGVRVNAVAPSLAAHPHLVKVTSAELLGELTAREAFGRSAEPWEIANAIVFLASDYSSYLTGETVSVSSQRA